jgi:hypothetical protein
MLLKHTAQSLSNLKYHQKTRSKQDVHIYNFHSGHLRKQ